MGKSIEDRRRPIWADDFLAKMEETNQEGVAEEDLDNNKMETEEGADNMQKINE